MFAENGVSDSHGDFVSGDDNGSSGGNGRQQYTLKGVEKEAISLMREAASAQGMKIGHWVSDRIKEAAVSALRDAERKKVALEAVVGETTTDDQVVSDVELDAGRVDPMEKRLRSLELELREITRVQRDMLLALMARK